MTERGSALIEVIVALAVAAAITAQVVAVLVQLPPQANRWEDTSELRQRMRVIETRMGAAVAGAGPIVLQVHGAVVRVPALWPRRLGLVRAGLPADVSTAEVTFLSRPDGHRALTLDEAMPAGGGAVAATGSDGCGADAACGLAEGDAVLIAEPGGAFGLYRIEEAGGPLTLSALMPAGVPAVTAGALVVPVAIDTIGLDAGAGELRVYDGYRSDNVIVDRLEGVTIRLEAGERPHPGAGELGGPFFDVAGSWRGTGRLGDGPFAGAGALAFDIDQLLMRQVVVDAVLREPVSALLTPLHFEWRSAAWH